MEPIPQIIHESWHRHIQPLFELADIKELKYKILPAYRYYPPQNYIFRVLQMPLDKVKVVILGQDPYPKAGQANGLAFAVNEHIPTPKSLKVIYQELLNEEKLHPGLMDKKITPERWNTLLHWWIQGIMPLNTSLTVEAGSPGSHSKYWEDFTGMLINIIAKEAQPIWLLWGSHAKNMGSYIFDHHSVDRVRGAIDNRTMSTAHPASEGRGGKFYGCNHFIKVNELLEQSGRRAINW